MSRIKELKENPEHCINIVDILSLLCPEGKTKYVETLLRFMKNSTNIVEIKNQTMDSLCNDFEIDKRFLLDYSPIQIIFIRKLFDDFFQVDDLKMFQKFCNYNERNLIEENDVSKYTSFKQLEPLVQLSELKLTEKEMESQVIKLFQNDEWVVLKPLTYKSSVKYGSNTKWCTASNVDSSSFEKYGKGILIYTINKITNFKVATYKDLQGDEFSFWNPEDKKVDSLETNIPYEILKIIRDEIVICKTGNINLKSI